MKKTLSIGFAAITIVLGACNGLAQNNKTKLSEQEFAAKIKELPSAPLLDVRTPEEFEKGHIQNAKNINWNGDDFDKRVAALDKTKPVLVYCLSGGRSSSAASKLRNDGFKEVYELNGGMMKWRAAGLPETTENAVISDGMSKQQFDEQLNTSKLVLIDFYAQWCAPCKKMKPYLEEIARDMAETVVVIRIDVDDNKALCKELNISELPVLQLYKNKALIWANQGFIEKEEVVKHLR